jgi:hypothetical protein
MYLLYLKLWFRVMVLNATFYIISTISCFIGGGNRSTWNALLVIGEALVAKIC